VELSESEIAEFQEVFDLVDKDRGGTIQANEASSGRIFVCFMCAAVANRRVFFFEV
jgi:hypothetical protein